MGIKHTCQRGGTWYCAIRLEHCAHNQMYPIVGDEGFFHVCALAGSVAAQVRIRLESASPGQSVNSTACAMTSPSVLGINCSFHKISLSLLICGFTEMYVSQKLCSRFVKSKKFYSTDIKWVKLPQIQSFKPPPQPRFLNWQKTKMWGNSWKWDANYSPTATSRWGSIFFTLSWYMKFYISLWNLNVKPILNGNSIRKQILMEYHWQNCEVNLSALGSRTTVLQQHQHNSAYWQIVLAAYGCGTNVFHRYLYHKRILSFFGRWMAPKSQTTNFFLRIFPMHAVLNGLIFHLLLYIKCFMLIHPYMLLQSYLLTDNLNV